MMRSNRLTTAALVVGLIAPLAAAGAQQKEAPPPAGTPKNFTLPPKRTFILPNGLQVTLIPYGEIPKATVELSVRAGSANEAASEVWVANMTGDFLREGTTSRTAAQIAEETADMGGSLYVQVQSDQTDVGADILGEHAPAFVRLLADVVMNPAFPESELPRIRATRLRSLAIGRAQPQSLALEKFRQVVFGDHPYGRLFPTEQVVQGHTIDRLRQFHQQNYGAGRAHLYVAGRFDGAVVEQAIREVFGNWQRGTPAPPPAARARSERAVHLIDRPGAVQSTIYLGIPVVDPSSPEYQALRVTNALLGGSFTSRITLNLRENKGYTYSPTSVLGLFPKAAYWAQTADVTTNVTGPSLKEIFHEIDRLRADAPSADELRGIQNFLAGIFVLQNSTRAGIINQLQFAELHGLGDDYLNTVVSRVMAVTPQEVQRIARQYLDPAKMAIVVVGDEKQIAEQVAPYRTATP